MKYDYVRLGDVCEIVSGTTPKTSVSSYWDGDQKWITPAELDGNSLFITDSVRHISLDAVKDTGLRLLPKGTVILSSRAPIGKTAIAGCPLYCNQGFKNLICSPRINNLYLYLYLSSKTDFLNSLGRGATFKEISKSIVADIKIPLPPLQQQKETARKLLKIRELVSYRNKQCNLLNRVASSRFVEMFGTEQNSRYPVLNITEVAKDIFAGGDVPKDFTKTPDVAHQIPIYSNGIEKDGLYGFASVPRVTSPCLTVSARGTIGSIFIRTQPFVPIVRLVVVIPNTDKVNLVFLSFALRGRFASKTGSSIPQLPVPLVKATKMVLPPLELQNEFAAFIEQLDKSKVTIRKSIEKLELLYKALLQEYFG